MNEEKALPADPDLFPEDEEPKGKSGAAAQREAERRLRRPKTAVTPAGPHRAPNRASRAVPTRSRREKLKAPR